MATVGLTEYVINSIGREAARIVRLRQGPRNRVPKDAPDGVGDELFSLFLPPEKEAIIKEHLPPWAMGTQKGMLIALDKDLPNSMEYVFAPFTEKHIPLAGSTIVHNIPGIANANLNNECVLITLASDGTVIKYPALRSFIESCNETIDTNHRLDSEIKKAQEDMETFLRQYRTLQKAIKAFGPALMEFVPAHIKQAYDRVPAKREKPVKPEPITVNTDYLVAAATAYKLGLN